MGDRMNRKKEARRGGPTGRRATIRSGGPAISDIAERIARQVNSMSPAQIDAYIVEHGLTHLADPERLEAILKMAITDEDAAEADDPQPQIPSRRFGDTAGQGAANERGAPSGDRRKDH
jgi:hypothetical protein